MYCVACGNKLSKDVTFCDRCGHKVGGELHSTQAHREDKPKKGVRKVLYVVSTPFRLLWRYRIGLVVAISLLCSTTALGLAAYNHINNPQVVKRQVVEYVNAHKEELKGERGDDGIDGLDGQDGATGASTYSAPSSLHCTSSTYGEYFPTTTTDCY